MILNRGKNKVDKNINFNFYVISVLIIIFLILTLTYGIKLFRNDQQNLVYRCAYHQFDPDTNTAEGSDQYLERVPMEEMDFPAFDISIATAPVGVVPYFVQIELPEDLTYYREILGVKVPALTLKKGSILTFTEKSSNPYGYGYLTFPTYERGWRYAAPFQTGNEIFQYEGEILSQEDITFYYVRLEDIEKLYKLSVKKISEAIGTERYDANMREALLYTAVRRVDQLLASDNIYLSPDIGGSVFSPSDWVYVVAAGTIIVLIFIFLFRLRRKIT